MASGILCNEPIRGVRFNLMDVSLHRDAVHRGADQLGPAMRNAVYASILTAKPVLIEPYYMVDIQAPEKVSGAIYSALSYKRGKVIDKKDIDGTPMVNMKGY